METREDSRLTKFKLIEYYINDFKSKTGSNLLDEFMIYSRRFHRLSKEHLKSLVNEHIPKRLIDMGINSICAYSRIRELTYLKMIYGKLCQDCGYTDQGIAESINLDRSTISQQVKNFRYIINHPDSYETLIELYNNIQFKIIEYYERVDKDMQRLQDYPESSISPLFNTRESKSC